MNKPGKSLQSLNLKQQNRMMILNLLKDKVMSRAEISQVLEMSRPAVSSIINGLVKEGLIKEIGFGKTTKVGGKRPILLDINKDAGNILTVYYDGSTIQLGLCNLKSEIVRRSTYELLVPSNPEEGLKKIATIIKSFLKADSEISLLACGFVIKGIVNTREAKLKYSVAFPGWEDVSFGKMLEEEIKIPVYLESNARAHTLELLKREKNYCQVFVSVRIDVGIGTGVVINNQLYRGAYEGAVNFAHTTIQAEGRLCSCGNRGCWEALASTKSMLEMLNERTKQVWTWEKVLKAYQEKVPIVVHTLHNETAYWIGVGLANIARVFEPEKIAIETNLTMLGEGFQQIIRETFKEKAAPVFHHSPISFSIIEKDLLLLSGVDVVLSYFYTTEEHDRIWRSPAHYPLLR